MVRRFLASDEELTAAIAEAIRNAVGSDKKASKPPSSLAYASDGTGQILHIKTFNTADPFRALPLFEGPSLAQPILTTTVRLGTRICC
jgi:hypothetical protein